MADTQPYGSVSYADPGYQKDKVKRYPIDTAAHVKAAWSYINMPKNASQYSSGDLAAIKGRIRAAAKKFGIQISDSGRTMEEQMSEIERRYTLVPVELRASAGRRAIGGYASVFKRISGNLGGFVEQVMPTFFNKSRGDGWPDVLCRYNHDDNMLLGTIGGGTLRLQVDETGLLYEVDPPAARADILELVQRGDVRKSSFAFKVHQGGDEWTQSDQGYPLRSLHTGQLIDVAPVNIPAYTDSTVGLRSLAAHFEADFEEVSRLASENELRKFFVRTDGTSPKKKSLSGAQALIALQSRRDPLEDFS